MTLIHCIGIGYLLCSQDCVLKQSFLIAGENTPTLQGGAWCNMNEYHDMSFYIRISLLIVLGGYQYMVYSDHNSSD